MLYQSDTLAEFLNEMFKMFEPPHESAVDNVHEDRRFNVYRENPDALDHAAALAGDDELHAFADELDERFRVRRPALTAGGDGIHVAGTGRGRTCEGTGMRGSSRTRRPSASPGS